MTSGMDVPETLSEAKVDDDFAPFERVDVGRRGARRAGPSAASADRTTTAARSQA